MINTNNPIISWLRNNKIIVFIIVLAFVLRIAMLFAVYSNAGDYSHFIENIKADGYYDIGYTLANEGGFAIDDVEVLDSVRTPGYPLIVAGFLIAFGSVWFLLIVQIFIASIIPL